MSGSDDDFSSSGLAAMSEDVIGPAGQRITITWRGVDPSIPVGSALYKKEKRLADNRASAARSRALQKLKLEKVEQSTELEAENKRLKEEVARLTAILIQQGLVPPPHTASSSTAPVPSVAPVAATTRTTTTTTTTTTRIKVKARGTVKVAAAAAAAQPAPVALAAGTARTARTAASRPPSSAASLASHPSALSSSSANSALLFDDDEEDGNEGQEVDGEDEKSAEQQQPEKRAGASASEEEEDDGILGFFPAPPRGAEPGTSSTRAYLNPLLAPPSVGNGCSSGGLAKPTLELEQLPPFPLPSANPLFFHSSSLSLLSLPSPGRFDQVKITVGVQQQPKKQPEHEQEQEQHAAFSLPLPSSLPLFPFGLVMSNSVVDFSAAVGGVGGVGIGAAAAATTISFDSFKATFTSTSSSTSSSCAGIKRPRPAAKTEEGESGGDAGEIALMAAGNAAKRAKKESEENEQQAAAPVVEPPAASSEEGENEEEGEAQGKPRRLATRHLPLHTALLLTFALSLAVVMKPRLGELEFQYEAEAEYVARGGKGGGSGRRMATGLRGGAIGAGSGFAPRGRLLLEVEDSDLNLLSEPSTALARQLQGLRLDPVARVSPLRWAAEEEEGTSLFPPAFKPHASLGRAFAAFGFLLLVVTLRVSLKGWCW